MRLSLTLSLVLLASPLTGCGGDDSPPAPPQQSTTPSTQDGDCSDLPGVTWENWGQGFYLTYCDICHTADAPNRYGAQIDLVMDTLDQVRERAERSRYRVVELADHPDGGGIVDDDLVLYEVFLDCAL